MKPDRFNAIVEPVIPHAEDCVAHVNAAALLRRQHQSIVRLVTQHKFSKHNNAYEAAWDRPLDMILAALKRRAR
jgi:hypothetical protein